METAIDVTENYSQAERGCLRRMFYGMKKYPGEFLPLGNGLYYTNVEGKDIIIRKVKEDGQGDS